MEQRYLHTSLAVAYLLREGVWVYSPIVHCHELAKRGNLPREASFWREYNFHMLARSEEMLILRIEGYLDSIGIEEERTEARRLMIPWRYL